MPNEVAEFLKQIENSAKAIALGMGAKGAEKKRKKEYRKILKLQKKLQKHYCDAMVRLQSKQASTDQLPSLELRIENIVEQMSVDIHNVELCAKNALLRVIEGGKVAAEQKVLGVSDPDAEMISKGKRPVIFGFKPQVARSLAGFIVAIEVPPGAASDSSMAVEIIKACIKNTDSTPKLVSFDDGYSSLKNRSDIEGLGVELVSFSGSKGKTITPEDLWDSKEHLSARNKRSMAESTMAVLKRDFGKDQLSRRGIHSVKKELKAVAIFHNLRLICRLSKKKLKNAA